VRTANVYCRALLFAAILVLVLAGCTAANEKVELWANYGEIAQGVVAILLLLFSLVIRNELRESVRARYLDGMQTVREFIVTEEAAKTRKWVYSELPKRPRPLSDEDLEKVISLCRQFDHLGLLCRRGLLPKMLVAETYARNIVDMWNALQPEVFWLREKLNDEDRYAEFEWLAAYSSEYENSQVRRLQRWWRRYLRNRRKFPLHLDDYDLGGKSTQSAVGAVSVEDAGSLPLQD